MIQRIQTVYLLIAIFLTGSLFFLPYAEMINSNGELFLLDAKGLYPVAFPNAIPLYVNIVVQILCAASISSMIIAIFRFRHLARQIVLTKLTLLMLLGLGTAIFYGVWKGFEILAGTYSLKIYALFPVIAFILVFMALRGIRKDNQLLKSIDRIR